MVIQKIFNKIKDIKDSKQKDSSLTKKRRKKKSKEEYENRFQKFYHLNKKRLNKERRESYNVRMRRGICVRCSKKVVKGIVFCEYHQQKQKEYNKKARDKRKKKA